MKSKQEIIEYIIPIHTQASAYWNILYRRYFNNEHMPYMKQNVKRLVNLIKDIFLKPTLETKDETELDELTELAKLTSKTLYKNNKEIKTAMRDGVITNNGILHIYWNYDNSRILLKRRQPHKIIYFEDLFGQVYVIDIENNIMWTKEKIYYLNESYKIIREEVNFYGIIPFVQYSPHDVETGGTENSRDFKSIYGTGAEELKNLQDRLDTIGELRLDTLMKIQDPPIVYYGGVTKETADTANEAGARIKLLSPDDKFTVLDMNNQLALSTLEQSEQKNKRYITEVTGQTDATMGLSTAASMSGETIKQHKSAMQINLRDYEDAYITMFDDVVKIIMTFYYYKHKKFQCIDLDEIKIQKWNEQFNNTEYMTLLQNFSGYISQAQDPTSLEMMYLVIQPQVRKVAAQTDNPEAFIKKFDDVIEVRKQMLQQQLDMQLQQMSMQQQQINAMNQQQNQPQGEQ